MIQSNMNGMPSFHFNSFLITKTTHMLSILLPVVYDALFSILSTVVFFFSFSFLASFPCVLVPPTKDATRESNEETQGERDVRL